MNYNCRACGLYIDNAPWGENGNLPAYEICPCCGVEFGNEDYTLESVRRYRAHWLDSGMQWFIKKEKPLNWDKDEQMKQVPIEWL